MPITFIQEIVRFVEITSKNNLRLSELKIR